MMSEPQDLAERVAILEKTVAELRETVRALQAAQKGAEPKPELRSRGMLDRPKAR